jgi:hypothetical protein
MYNFEYIAVEEMNEHLHVYGLIDWCITPTLAIFQLYRHVNKFYFQ